MARTHQNNLSLWQEDLVLPDTPTLAKSATTEVCIVGAGFSGLLTAYRLLKNSHKVIVIDRDGLGYGDSALSSAHLSDVLDDHFTEIIRKHGKEKARIAYESHRDAIDLIENIVRDEKIECDFVRLDGYLFLSPGQDPEFLETEMQAALDCGVENVKKIEQPEDVFFDAGLCLQFADQAQFHPVKFLNGLCERIRLMGGQIFTNTSAEVIEDGPQVRVRTANGCQITCQHAVVATNVPVNNIMSVHLKEAAFRSYVIGMKVPRGNLTPALFWDTGKPYHYIRLDMAPERDFDVLLVGGEDHRVGQENHPERIFQKLRDWVESRLGVVDPEVIYNWSGQIIEPMDGVAYIGKNPGAENVYVVTGDSGQGVTHAAIASHLLTALIQKEEHPWEKLYDPSRFNWRSLNEFVRDAAQSSAQYADWIYRDEKQLKDLRPGEGCVMTEGLAKVALYRDREGDIHKLSAVCTHMGGIVKWNAAEETWDCPCHGSRFSKLGEVLNGPAIHDLSPHQTELEKQQAQEAIIKKQSSDIDLMYRGSR